MSRRDNSRVTGHGGCADAKILRSDPRDLATRAIGLEPDDPVAQEVLRELEDGPSPALHTPAPEAARWAGQADVLFAQARYAEALKFYEEAMRADPLYSKAWVYAGDCYYERPTRQCA